MTHRFQSLALLLAPLVACGGQALDVGSNSGGSSSSGAGGSGAANGAGNMSTGATAGNEQGPSDPGVGANGNVSYAGSSNGPACGGDPLPGEPLPVWPNREDCQEGTSALQGTWTGYVQGQGAGSYLDEGNFKVTLKGDDGALCGTIAWGTPTELEPATNPEASYPPGYDLSKWIPLVDGYTYQLTAPVASGKRVQFAILLAEPMRSWCQLQTPYFDETNGQGWHCARNLGTSYVDEPEQECRQSDPCTGETFTVSCARHEICISLAEPCACNENGCDGNSEAIQHHFDLRFEADEATGELDGKVVYLTRD